IERDHCGSSHSFGIVHEALGKRDATPRRMSCRLGVDCTTVKWKSHPCVPSRVTQLQPQAKL
ncbi:hypothetical protein NPIL_193681, partial [Nephila pilipes]